MKQFFVAFVGLSLLTLFIPTARADETNVVLRAQLSKALATADIQVLHERNLIIHDGTTLHSPVLLINEDASVVGPLFQTLQPIAPYVSSDWATTSLSFGVIASCVSLSNTYTFNLYIDVQHDIAEVIKKKDLTETGEQNPSQLEVSFRECISDLQIKDKFFGCKDLKATRLLSAMVEAGAYERWSLNEDHSVSFFLGSESACHLTPDKKASCWFGSKIFPDFLNQLQETQKLTPATEAKK